MSDPNVSPIGVFVPAWLASSRSINASTLRTWILLSGLAAGKVETPPFSLDELGQAVGKGRTILYQQLSSLRKVGALSWRFIEDGRLVVLFAGDLSAVAAAPGRGSSPGTNAVQEQASGKPDLESGKPDLESGKPDSESGKPDSESGKPDLESGKPDSQTEISPKSSKFPQESGFLKTGFSPSLKTSLNLNINLKKIKEGEGNPGIRKPGTAPPQTGKASDPGAVYRRITSLSLNGSQRQLIAEQVADLSLWETTLEHWTLHGWNPRNIPGILDLYSRGGPPACTRCKPNEKSARPDPIQELRKKHGIP